jgi:hypothetical protein
LTGSGATLRANYKTPVDYKLNNAFAGPYLDGSFAMQTGSSQWGIPLGSYYPESGTTELFRTDTGAKLASNVPSGLITVTPAFSRRGDRVVFSWWNQNGGRSLGLMDFSCSPISNPGGGPSCAEPTFGEPSVLFTGTAPAPYGQVGYAAWTPDDKAVVFHHSIGDDPTTCAAKGGGELCDIKGGDGLGTWRGALAEIWYVSASGGPALRLDQLNGVGHVPTGIPLHAKDAQMNYEPTVNPIVSGGYAWVVFTSRRAYGNLITKNPWNSAAGTNTEPVAKKLWVAAVSLDAEPGADPSFPAFYLPGQEINAGNMRGFWVVDPCKPTGSSCATGDECCDGYCRANSEGELVCAPKPEGCAQELERCEVDEDCCAHDQGIRCINGLCTKPAPPMPR